MLFSSDVLLLSCKNGGSAKVRGMPTDYYPDNEPKYGENQNNDAHGGREAG